MTTEAPQCACGRPCGSAAICQTCEDRMEGALGDVSALCEQLDIVLSRQAKAGGVDLGKLSASSTRPLPYDVKASEVASHLKATLVAWVLLVHDEDPHARALPADDTPALARWLLRATPFLRMHEAASEAVDEIAQAVEGARRVAYRQARGRYYRGPCRAEYLVEDESEVCCTADLYMRGIDAVSITCPNCGSEHNTEVRRAWLMEQAEGQIYTQAEILALLRALGTPIPQSTLAMWVKRDKIASCGQLPPKDGEEEGSKLYRMGEVMVLVARSQTRRTSIVA